MTWCARWNGVYDDEEEEIAVPFVSTNGIRLAYQRSGRGEPVLLIMGSSAAGRVWTMYQTPALNQAGYETITFDNRGIPPSDVPPGDYSLAEMTADTVGLINALALGPCRIVGTSLGALIAQELAIHWPHLVRSAVLVATRARSDVTRKAQSAADRALRDSGIRLPPTYQAIKSVMEMLSPATLNDDAVASGWLEVFELSGHGSTAHGQAAALDKLEDRRQALRNIAVPCRAVAFADDLICPPHLVAEVADAITDCDFVEIAGCGHLGYLERPDAVNLVLLEFLDKY